MISCSHFDEVSVLTLIGKLRQRGCNGEYAWREQKPRGGTQGGYAWQTTESC
jgi:hypothetical protein